MNDMTALWVNLYHLIVRPDAGNYLERDGVSHVKGYEVGALKGVGITYDQVYVSLALVGTQSETQLDRLLI